MLRIVPLLAVVAVGLNSCNGAAPKGAVESAAAGIASLLGASPTSAAATMGPGAHPPPHLHRGAEGGQEEPLPGALGGAGGGGGYAGDVGSGSMGTDEVPDVHEGHACDAPGES